jgi:hypothetical protein
VRTKRYVYSLGPQLSRLNRSAHLQGLRNAATYEYTRANTKVSRRPPFALLRPRRRARFEKRRRSTRESSHSRINNVRRRTKILPPTAYSRTPAQRATDGGRLLGEIGSGPIGAHGCNIRRSRGIQNGHRHYRYYHRQQHPRRLRRLSILPSPPPPCHRIVAGV